MPAVFVDGVFVPAGAVSRNASAQVTLGTTFPNGIIFYTTDHSIPDFNSRLYNGPFELHRSATVRALAYDANFAQHWESDPIQIDLVPAYEVRVTTQGGGSVTISPGNGPYLSNTIVTLTAKPAAGWTFLQWLGAPLPKMPSASVVGDHPINVEAVFGTSLFTANSGAGAILVQPIAPVYPYDSTATLTASPQTGNYFVLWGNAASDTNSSLRFRITNANPTVSALFGAVSSGQYTLTVIPDGNGQVAVNPRGNRYANTQTVTVTPLPDSGQSFLGWTGDASGASNPLSVPMTQHKTLTAHFSKRPTVRAVDLGGFLSPGKLVAGSKWKRALTSWIGRHQA
jgi:uncharacterized repeat protein (TIGR02543 family)